MEKLLEEVQANKEANANELEVTAKETQDAGKQDSDANVNRVKVGKDSNSKILAVKFMGKPKRNPEVEKKEASASVGDVGQNTSQRNAWLLGKHAANALRRINSHVPVEAIKF